MIVRCETDGTVRLLEPADLKAFSIAMPDTDGARAALATVARLDGPGHAWFAPDLLRTLAGEQAPGWAAAFDGMVAYAARKGWMDADGRMRGHIVHDQ